MDIYVKHLKQLGLCVHSLIFRFISTVFLDVEHYSEEFLFAAVGE